MADDKKNIPDTGKVDELPKPGKVGSIKADPPVQGQPAQAKTEAPEVEDAPNAKEAGDVPLTLQDYKNIPEYTFDYDDVIKVVQGSNGVKIQLGKKINGHTIITEIVSNERGAVTFKNMWGVDTEKYLRKYKSRAVGNRAASQHTPDASMFPSANTASADFSIPTLERNVNAQQIPSLEPDMPAGTVAGNAPPSLYDGLPESIGAMRHNPRSYAGMQVEYGTIAPGENAARVVDVPISTNGTDRVSASVRTFMEAPQTTDELVGMFEKGVEDGLFSHDVKRDADSLARAVSAIEQDGYQTAVQCNGCRSAGGCCERRL